MTTPETWQLPSSEGQPAAPKEILETSSRRWPRTLVVVVALLIGIGLGNAFFGDTRRLDDSLDRLEVLTQQLHDADAQIDRLRADDRLPAAIVQARAERAAIASELDQAVVDGARLFTAGLPGLAHRATAPPAVQDLLATHVDATNDGSAERLLGTFTPDGVLTLMAPAVGGWQTDFHGTEIGSGFLKSGPHRLRLTTAAVQHGAFVWARYADSGDRGVLVVRVKGRRIAHAWFVLANAPVGMR